MNLNSMLGWALALLAVFVGWRAYGWQGVLLAVTLTVFWLLLQFSRVLRAMKLAGQAPVGHVPSAVMLNAKLARGMTMMKVTGLTKSLGTKVGDSSDTWCWRDDGGASVTVSFERGRCARWALQRDDLAQP